MFSIQLENLVQFDKETSVDCVEENIFLKGILESSSIDNLLMNTIKLLDGLEELFDKYRRDSYSDDEEGRFSLAHNAYLNWDALAEVFILLKDKADEVRSFMLKEISEDLLAVVPSPGYCDDLGFREKT